MARSLPPLIPALYVLWASLAIGLAFAAGGLSDENLTRIGVLGCLAAQLLLRKPLLRACAGLAPKVRFMALGLTLAAVVEGLHMHSKPVFDSLRVSPVSSLPTWLGAYALDLLFTLPAYLVIFGVIWFFINRYQYSLWGYALLMALSQTIGDGGLFFFLSAPALLAFLPYPMSNYHAINLLPFLAVRDQLNAERRAGPRAYLAFPGVIAAYLVCGALIKVLGRLTGLEVP